MIKCFLSHSSKDKTRYVEIVAKKIGLENCIYDVYTFEAGMKSLDEILKGLNNSELFVIFLSEAALESDWVKLEIVNAKKRLDSGQISKIFPIIIDENLIYSDQRIPDWMREEYNLKYISRPTIAARRIKQRLKEISWNTHPQLRERNQLFVGRNLLVKNFEERIDDFEKEKPTCIIASGVPSIGRRSLIHHCLIKSNIISESYKPAVISLTAAEGIEDLILKLIDLGFSNIENQFHFMKMPIEEKVELVKRLSLDIQKEKEIIFIVDYGCIVTFEREIIDWFLAIIKTIQNRGILTFCLISRFHPNEKQLRYHYSFFNVEVPELDPTERKGLFKRYSELIGLDLSKDEYASFSSLLKGYPEQVFFAADHILEYGSILAMKESNQIIEYNKNKVQTLLKVWDNDKHKLDLLRLLSEFDFISYELISEILNNNDAYVSIVQEFRACGIVEFIGANKEYIRVLENVRDYILRMRFALTEEFRKKLSKHIGNFFSTYEDDEKDVSDFLYSIRTMLKEKKQIDEKYLIPSHFLITIKELYDRDQKWNEVVNLSDRVLTNNHQLDKQFERNVRYYLCLALSRLQDNRCLKEIHAYFTDKDFYFLLGFYYRNIRRYSDAIEQFKLAIQKRPEFEQAQREMVWVLQHIGEYKESFELARQNYDFNQANPYQIQAYLNCLLKDLENKDSNKEKIEELLQSLESISSNKAKEMYLTAKAEYIAFHKNDKELAYSCIDDAKNLFPEVIYPKLTEFDICTKFRDVERMKQTLDEIEKDMNKKNHNNSLVRRQCIYFAAIGKLDDAKRYMTKHLNNYTPNAMSRFENLLSEFSSDPY